MAFIPPIDFCTTFMNVHYPNKTSQERREYLLTTISNLRDELGKNPKQDINSYWRNIRQVSLALGLLGMHDPHPQVVEIQELFSNILSRYGYNP